MKNTVLFSFVIALVVLFGGCNKDPQPDQPDNPNEEILPNKMFEVDGEKFVLLECTSGQRWFLQLLPSNNALLANKYSPGYEYVNNGAQFQYRNEYKGDLVVPDTFVLDGTTYTITQIARCVFDGCDGLNSIVIPNTVKHIGDQAFLTCFNLNHVQLPSALDSIQNSTFYQCERLRSIHFPESLKYVGGCAFAMSGIEELSFTNNIKLDEGVFMECHHLETVSLPDGMDAISRDLFASCDMLSSVSIPQSVKVIADGAFYGTNLSSVALPNSLQYLGGFAYCSRLTEVVIPESVDEIADMAFFGCSNLETITCLAPIPPVLHHNAGTFEGAALTAIYVPAESLESYRSADGWCDYADIIQPLS
ncbi:MAG: leucine-rich repeat domain-containing protein [Bacteroidales bacterium]|nr:leucine-rich repeat domain-containing protein [Bacteroidales bacterium]